MRMPPGLAISMGRPWMVFNAIIEPKAGDSSTRYGVEVAKDGRFRADDVPAGEYVLNVVLHEPPPGQSPGWGAPIAAFTRAFKVEGTRGTLDLGTLTPIENRVRPVEVGQLAPDFNARALDGHDESLSRFKGKFVLLSFWMNSLECHQETTILNGVEERFAGDSRLAMISISLDEEPEFATRLTRSRKSAR